MTTSKRHRPRRERRPNGGGGGTPDREAPRELHPTEDPPEIESFQEWPLGEELQGAIADMGITVPTPIQSLAIGPVLEGKDVIAKAETGTGKTLAFGAPMMAKVDPARATVLGLVLCPTRELAQQVAGVLEVLGKARGLSVALVVGGDPPQPQVDALQSGAQVVVGTPGRVLDLYNQRFLSFPWTEFAVLDEADEMLEIGFLPDVEKILSFLPDERQTLLFSATFPPELLRLARRHTGDPAEIATASGVSTVDTIHQEFLQIDEGPRVLDLIRRIERSEPDDVFLIFCSRRTDVERLLRRLERLRFPVKALHGGYDQSARFRVMSAFREKQVKALVATDVASRGLDVNHVTHVINFQVPRAISDYTHRIGRTGRAGREGAALTYVSPEDVRRWRGIQRDATWPIHETEAMGARPQARRRSERDSGRSAREERPKVRSRHDSDERTARDSETRERRPRRDRDERAPRAERESGRTQREERPKVRSRHDSDERPTRDSETRERRPRRDRDERAPRAEREGARTQREERPKVRSRHDSDERPARESETRERRPRRDRDERAPRAEREGARTQREERPKVRSRHDSDERPARESETRERRPRRDRDERAPRAEREGGRTQREERPKVRSRHDSDERPARDSEPRERRPRRDRDERAPRAEREGARTQREERPKVRSRHDSDERPARDSETRERRPRRDRDERPRSGDSRDERPASRSEPKESPARRDSKPAPKPSRRAESDVPFGAFADDSTPTEKPAPPAKPRRTPSKPKAAPRKPPESGGTGFGAGI